MTWVTALLIGTATGVLSGMGIGGGTLLVLYLTAVLGTDPYTAAGINLIYFLGCAPSSLVLHIKAGRVHRRIALITAVGGVIAAALAAWLAPNPTPDWLRRGFGILLLLVGIREAWSLIHSAKNSG